MKRRLALVALLALAPAIPAEAGQRAVARVLAAAEQSCADRACVEWIMDTVAAESCFKPNAVNRNRNGSRDEGIAQRNNRHPPRELKNRDPWNVEDSIAGMAEAHANGHTRAWFGSGRRAPKGCGWR